MPPKSKKNRKNNKKADGETPVNADQDQATFQTATEEEKTEEQPVSTEATQAETTEATDLTSARDTITEPEASTQEITTDRVIEEKYETNTEQEKEHQAPLKEEEATEKTVHHLEEGLKPQDQDLGQINERESLEEKMHHESAHHEPTAEMQHIAGHVNNEVEVGHVEHHEAQHEHGHHVVEEPSTVVIESDSTHTTTHAVHEAEKEHASAPETHVHEHTEPEVTHHVHAAQPVLEKEEEKPVEPETHVHEHKEPEVTHHVHAAPLSQPLLEQEEEKPVEHEVKTHVDSEVGVVHPSVQHEEEHPVVVSHDHGHVHATEEKLPEIATDAHEVHKVEHLVQHGAVEPEKENLYATKAPEHSDILTSSLQSNWEKFEHHPPAQEAVHAHDDKSHQDLSHSHVVVDHPSAHVVVESEGKGIAGHAGSLQESWNVITEKQSEEVRKEQEEEALSDRAVDNALNTRLMDDYPAEGNTFKEIASTHVEPSAEHVSVGITHNERLRRAEEHIKSAKVLEEQGKYGEAVNLLQSSKEMLNPDHFHGSEQTILEEVNKQMLDCTLEIAHCYDQLNDFNQSVKYARAILKTAPGNIQAIYLLGIGLVRRGDLEEARVVLKEAKEVRSSEEDAKYLSLINKELDKLDQIAESRSKVYRANPLEEDNQPLLVVNREGSVNEKQEGAQETSENKEDKKPSSSGSGSGSTEYFLGSLVSSSILSFVLAKYVLKFPTQRGIIASLMVGAIAGGVSLLASKKTDSKKQ